PAMDTVAGSEQVIAADECPTAEWAAVAHPYELCHCSIDPMPGSQVLGARDEIRACTVRTARDPIIDAVPPADLALHGFKFEFAQILGRGEAAPPPRTRTPSTANLMLRMYYLP